MNQTGYLILTNNPRVPELISPGEGHTVIFKECTVRALLAHCQELFLQGGVRLAVDPMSGRHARPFPCLTLVLQSTEEETPAEDWKRLLDYEQLDNGRREEYGQYGQALTEDYRILDRSFVSVVLEGF